MPTEFTKVDLRRVKQLRPFKIDYTHVRNLDYIDKDNRLPQSFVEYLGIVNVTKIQVAEQSRPKFPADLRYLQDFSAMQFPKGKMLILANANLYSAIKPSVEQYIKDLAYEGYFATAFTVANGTPKEMRDFIKSKMPVAGVLLIGNLPTAWFDLDGAEFPCDLYYMDVNGTWTDPDNDGKFEDHPTNVEPEIWVGRLWTPTGNGNDAALIKDYFDRNHKFRRGQLGYSDRALAFVDDDWAGFGDCALDLMFPQSHIEVITNPAMTDADRYKAEINDVRAWVQVCAHSSPNGHAFKVPTGSESVPNTYLRDVNAADAYFYNLFACSNALFTQPDYMGGWYIFDKSGGSFANGMAAVGSTKSGSMLMFENFYGPMGTGKAIGDGYIDWWKALGTTHDKDERKWFYGMVLLGDPTINWWSGVVPTLRDPYDGDTFDHFPRLTNFSWDAIGLDDVTYNIEIDAFGARESGKWAAEAGKTWLVSGSLTQNHYEHSFVGAQRGRWRVRAKVGSVVCPWSDWRYFKYTV